MILQTVIFNSLRKRRQNTLKLTKASSLLLAVIIYNCINNISIVSSFVAETNLPQTKSNILDSLPKTSNNSVNGSSESFVSENKTLEDTESKERSSLDDVEDSQVEGDASHDEAYTSIISNYYTSDPFFEDSKEAGNSNANQKHRKLVASEHRKNGKMRHKIRIKTKKVNPPKPSSMQKHANQYINTKNDELRNGRLPNRRPDQTRKQFYTKTPIVKSLPSRRNFNSLNKNAPRELSLKYQTNEPNTNLDSLRKTTKANKNSKNPPLYIHDLPRFSDENAFPPDDDWGKDNFDLITSMESEKHHKPSYARRHNLVQPRPEEISQMPKMKTNTLRLRDSIQDKPTTIEGRESNIGRPFSRNQVATERQSFSELIPVTEGEKSNKNLNNKKRVHSRTRSKSRLNKGRNKNLKDNINFKESDEFPQDEEGLVPILPDIEGGNDPFDFLESGRSNFKESEFGTEFGGPVIAGLPGGPKSHTFFEIMDDFFVEPEIRFPHPDRPPNYPDTKENYLSKHLYEDNKIKSPTEYPDFFELGHRELPASFLSHQPHNPSFHKEGPRPETFNEEKYHYLHKEPRYVSEPLRPENQDFFDQVPSPLPSHYQKEKFYADHPHPNYPPLKSEYYRVKETESYTNNHGGYVPKTSNIKRPFEDSTYQPLSQKGHPYAKPLKYHNPLDYSYNPSHVEEFEIRKLPPLESYHHKDEDYRPIVHELPRTSPYQHHDPPPVYHAKPDSYLVKHPSVISHNQNYFGEKKHFDFYPQKEYSPEQSFKEQSPYAFNLVSNNHKTPYYDDYPHVAKFGPPYKRQVNNDTKDHRSKGARLLKTNTDSLILPDNGFLDIPKLDIGKAFGSFSDNPDLSPPARFEIPEYLSRSLNEDLELEPGLFDNPTKNSYDRNTIDRKDGMTNDDKVSNFEVADLLLGQIESKIFTCFCPINTFDFHVNFCENFCDNVCCWYCLEGRVKCFDVH